MHDGAAILRAIRVNHDDDAPRLIYADWLEEHGGDSECDRAEFIRLDCERAHLPEQDPREAPLLARLYYLARKNESRWFGPLLDRVSPHRLYLWRGLAEIEAESTDLRRGLPADPANDPAFNWVTGVRLRDLQRDQGRSPLRADPRMFEFPAFQPIVPQWETSDWERLGHLERVATPHTIRVDGRAGEAFGRSLANCPLLAEVRSLELHLFVDDAALIELTRASWLQKVTSLNLWGCKVGPSGIHALCSSPHLGALETLTLACNPIGDEGVRTLAECSRLASLRRLNLRRTTMGTKGAEALARSPYLRQLDALSLKENKLEAAGVEALATSPLLATVRTLHLDTCPAEGAIALARSPHTEALRDLELGCRPLTEAAAVAIGNSPTLRGLYRLGLPGASLSAEAVTALVSGGGLNQLQVLELRFTDLDQAGFCALGQASGLPSLASLAVETRVPDSLLGEVLATSPLLRRLRRLWYIAIDLGAAGLDGLCRLINEGKLEDLHLPCCPLKEKALRKLADCPGLSGLVRLNLGEATGIGVRGLKALLTSPHLSKLALLDLSRCKIAHAVSALTEAKLEELVWIGLDHNHIDADGGNTLRAFQKTRPRVYLKAFHNECGLAIQPHWWLDSGILE